MGTFNFASERGISPGDGNVGTFMKRKVGFFIVFFEDKSMGNLRMVNLCPPLLYSFEVFIPYLSCKLMLIIFIYLLLFQKKNTNIQTQINTDVLKVTKVLRNTLKVFRWNAYYKYQSKETWIFQQSYEAKWKQIRRVWWRIERLSLF